MNDWDLRTNNTVNKSVRFSTDREGFLTQECPTCSKQFKVRFGSGAPGPIAFCPYCGHEGKDCWWTTAQANYLNQEMQKFASDVVEKTLRGTGFDFKRARVSNIPAPTESEIGWKSYQFKSGEAIKYQGSPATLQCPATGTVENVYAN